MTDTTAPMPEGVATPVDESAKAAPARAPDGKFQSPSAPPAVEPGATAEPVADQAPETTPEKTDAPKRNRTQERIAQLTAEKHAALREANAAKARLEALQKVAPPKADPNDYEAVQRENMRGVIREETAQQVTAQYEDAVTKAQRAQYEAFYTKVDAARERIPDIDKSIESFSRLPVSAHASEIIADSEVSAEIAHYLANNPREAYDIYQMSPAQQGRALARIEQRVSLPARRTSSAPPPPPTVTGAQPAAPKAPAEMSIADFQASLRKSGVIR